jgi:hypothetical protein
MALVPLSLKIFFYTVPCPLGCFFQEELPGSSSNTDHVLALRNTYANTRLLMPFLEF